MVLVFMNDKQIIKAYKWCIAFMAVTLAGGLIFHARTLIVAFELIAAIFAVLFVGVTLKQLFDWYNTNKK